MSGNDLGAVICVCVTLVLLGFFKFLREMAK